MWPMGAGRIPYISGGYYFNAGQANQLDYIDLAFTLEGAAWDLLDSCERGAKKAESFTNALFDIKVQEILEQLGLDVVPTDHHGAI